MHFTFLQSQYHVYTVVHTTSVTFVSTICITLFVDRIFENTPCFHGICLLVWVSSNCIDVTKLFVSTSRFVVIVMFVSGALGGLKRDTYLIVDFLSVGFASTLRYNTTVSMRLCEAHCKRAAEMCNLVRQSFNQCRVQDNT